jgi:hypothetical protein
MDSGALGTTPIPTLLTKATGTGVIESRQTAVQNATLQLQHRTFRSVRWAD